MRRVLVLLAGISLVGLAAGCRSCDSCGGHGHGTFYTGICDCDHSDRGCSYYGDPMAPYRGGALAPVPSGPAKPESIKEMPKNTDKGAAPAAEPEKKIDG